MINDTVYGIIHWDGDQWKPVKSAEGSIYGSSNDIGSVGVSL